MTLQSPAHRSKTRAPALVKWFTSKQLLCRAPSLHDDVLKLPTYCMDLR
jgi:hypothetical protein